MNDSFKILGKKWLKNLLFRSVGLGLFLSPELEIPLEESLLTAFVFFKLYEGSLLNGFLNKRVAV